MLAVQRILLHVVTSRGCSQSRLFGCAYFILTRLNLINNEDDCLHTNDGLGKWSREETCGSDVGRVFGSKIFMITSPYPKWNSATEIWLDGISQCMEIIRNIILDYVKFVKKWHSDTAVVVQALGANHDPYIVCVNGTNDAKKNNSIEFR